MRLFLLRTRKAVAARILCEGMHKIRNWFTIGKRNYIPLAITLNPVASHIRELNFKTKRNQRVTLRHFGKN